MWKGRPGFVTGPGKTAAPGGAAARQACEGRGSGHCGRGRYRRADRLGAAGEPHPDLHRHLDEGFRGGVLGQDQRVMEAGVRFSLARVNPASLQSRAGVSSEES